VWFLLLGSVLLIFLVFCVVSFVGVSVAHLFSFLCGFFCWGQCYSSFLFSVWFLLLGSVLLIFFVFCVMLLVLFVFVLCLVYSMLPVSLDYLFLIAPSVFSTIYLIAMDWTWYHLKTLY
jgi:hypothetical protein